MAQNMITFVYSITHDVPELVQVAEGLRERGILMLPSVGTTYMMADANAWESPNDVVAIRITGHGERPFTMALPHEFDSIEEYIAELAGIVLGNLVQGGAL
jgi:hypothetical protein